jgi:hypothetical protein
VAKPRGVGTGVGCGPGARRNCEEAQAMRTKFAVAAAGLFLLFAPRGAAAHCDTLDGPVVTDARLALEAKEVTPVLKWVRPADEAEIREAFARAVAVRAAGGDAAVLADRYFFETLVRVHRAGEGAPYNGLLPAGTAVDPGIAATDAALASGSADALVRLVAGEVEKGLRGRHARAAEARKHAGDSVDRGREYVAAYVDLMHYAERLVQAAGTSAPHGEHGKPAEHAH